MGQRRILLQTLLKVIIGGGPNIKNVWFQTPSKEKLSYPCIIYKLDSVDTVHADNSPYRHKKRYQVMIIDGNPDSEIPDKIADLPLCSFSRFYTADNLNHFVYNLYY